jgi:hypothetical protein
MVMTPTNHRTWIGRVLIAAVILWNVQCAIAFLAAPGTYTPGFELGGPASEAVVRGMGVLFLMWNVPYVVAMLHPVRHRTSLYEAVAMQAIGLAGESLLLWTLGGEHPVVSSTVLRFIAFDGAGLVALLLAVWVTRGSRRDSRVHRVSDYWQNLLT